MIATASAGRTIQRATVGTVVVWIGVVLLVRPGAKAGLFGAGAVLLVSAAVQSGLRAPGRRAYWVIGIILMALGARAVFPEGVPWLSLALIAVGAVIALRALLDARRHA